MKKFPICLQQDSMDCGVACISMVTQFYNHYYNIPELKENCQPTREGVSLKRIADTLESLGFRTIGGRVTVATLQKAQLPIILHWEQRHFVVLYKIKQTSKGIVFYIGDPACGLMKYSLEEFQEKWISTRQANEDKGIALFILQNELQIQQGKNKKKKENLLKILFPYLQQYKKFFFQLILGFGVLSCIQLAFPYLTKSIVDVGVESGNKNFIVLILLAQLVLLLSSTFIRMINNWVILHISTRINLSLVSDFLIKLMKLPMSFFDTKMTGDIVERIGDHKKIETFIVSQLLTLIYSCFTGIIFSIVLYTYDITIFSIYIIGSICYLSWLFFFMEKRKQLNYELFKVNAATNNVTYQIVNGMQEAKLQGCTQRRRWEWEDTKAKQFEVNIKSLKLSQTQEIGSFFINESKDMIITFLAVSAVIDGQITLGMMLAIQYIIGQLSAPINQMVSLVYNIQDVRISLERINEIKSKQEENEKCKVLPETSLSNGTIHIRNLNFKYEGCYNNVLKNINLDIHRNKTLAIVGSSGSGKTTLLKLLLQYYSDYEGAISVNNVDLKNINRDLWRSQCSVVMQDSYIFSESIAKNIATADEDIDTKKLRYATDMANISEFIDNLPLKYNTQIGIDGRSISQGQKQRILIARAIYKNSNYFFLDEATNSLDATNEKIILNNLESYLANKTSIIVAHRLSTVKNADNIIVLDNGEIVESGTHETLIALKGHYYKLIKNQLELGM